ncbi:FAD-binding protein [Georgenia sp. TF02-10]|uniref:FAD-binding and (Fe-S)-binding domain-containing protein n=1 Tax=Georgenia sp. TF02-10 TaxID=2917725 RepID=UPI001FA7B94C|nr:FAD-binding and (Fe-S)-binding domain-containing protein [Georgenia sp. TF02-10]UNX54496.1 FAD-binding protein [Georgenia sp. TF02-10]
MSIPRRPAAVDAATPDAAARDLVAELRAAVDGEVDDSARRRAEYATDASSYRVPPRVVVCPRDADDALAALAVARRLGVPVTARGAGTSVAGNAVGPGVVLDFAQHMNQVLALDPEARTAVVQPGVVMSALQAVAAPHGLRFGPDPSTQDRATLGGMIGNNACGPHAVAYGRTADNVRALDVVDGQGRRFTAGAGAGSLDAVPGLAGLVRRNLATIRTALGRFGRQVSGYSLEHLLPEHGTDLAKMLVGTEGTLVTVLSATLALVPVPAAPVVVALGYPDMPAAADAVPALLAHRPLAVEGLDARLVDVVRRHRGAGAVPELPAGAGWLLVEVGAEPGESDADVLARARALAADGGTAAARVVPAGAQAAALWRIRADGAGLGGRTPAGSPAWPGWEGAAVPPERLGDYLRDFTALMADRGVDGLLYGHFGDGCVHVRLDLPLETPAGIGPSREFLEAAADLVAGYGGSLSGEHGDGLARSELLTRMYAPEVIDLFGQVKALFDPAGGLNPGVVVDPRPLDADLRRPHARRVPARGGFAFAEDDGDFTTAVHRCTGVGKCRADTSGSGGFMCPSYRATKDEKDVTRGRARVLQELTNGSMVTDWGSAAVRDSLDLCLSCKACSADCPAGVDMAKYKSEVLHRTWAGRVRPVNHYALGQLPRWTTLVTAVPAVARLANAVLSWRPLARLVLRAGGMDPRREMVTFAEERFSRWFRRRGEGGPDGGARTSDGDLRQVDGGGAAPVPGGGARTSDGDPRPVPGGGARAVDRAPRRVVLWADTFSETLDGAGARAAAHVLEEAGYTVVVPDEPACCGLTWISTGQLDGARKRLRHLLGVLAPYAANGIPIVGVEPSCTAVLRSDLLDLLPDDPRAPMVAANAHTLAELLTAPAPLGPGPDWQPPSLAGVDVVAQPHCHHHSVMGWDADAALLARTGATVTRLAGCCGLAGNFGMEAGHYETSVAVAENALLPALREAGPQTVYLADGYSCRTQAAQLAGRRGTHLAELLAGQR